MSAAQEKIYPVKDGLPKFKTMPTDFGGCGTLLPEDDNIDENKALDEKLSFIDSPFNTKKEYDAYIRGEIELP